MVFLYYAIHTIAIPAGNGEVVRFNDGFAYVLAPSFPSVPSPHARSVFLMTFPPPGHREIKDHNSSQLYNLK